MTAVDARLLPVDWQPVETSEFLIEGRDGAMFLIPACEDHRPGSVSGNLAFCARCGRAAAVGRDAETQVWTALHLLVHAWLRAPAP